MSSGLWSVERTQRVAEMWESGSSATEIAAAFGDMTRNMVIGKVHRLGLTRAPGSRSKPAKAPLAGVPSVAPAPASVPQTVARLAPVRLTGPVPPSPLPPDAVAVPVSIRVTIDELRDSMCRWPLGNPATPEFRYCGGTAIEGKPYCAAHADMAYLAWGERSSR